MPWCWRLRRRWRLRQFLLKSARWAPGPHGVVAAAAEAASQKGNPCPLCARKSCRGGGGGGRDGAHDNTSSLVLARRRLPHTVQQVDQRADTDQPDAQEAEWRDRIIEHNALQQVRERDLEDGHHRRLRRLLFLVADRIHSKGPEAGERRADEQRPLAHATVAALEPADRREGPVECRVVDGEPNEESHRREDERREHGGGVVHRRPEALLALARAHGEEAAYHRREERAQRAEHVGRFVDAVGAPVGRRREEEGRLGDEQHAAGIESDDREENVPVDALLEEHPREERRPNGTGVDDRRRVANGHRGERKPPAREEGPVQEGAQHEPAPQVRRPDEQHLEPAAGAVRFGLRHQRTLGLCLWLHLHVRDRHHNHQQALEDRADLEHDERRQRTRLYEGGHDAEEERRDRDQDHADDGRPLRRRVLVRGRERGAEILRIAVHLSKEPGVRVRKGGARSRSGMVRPYTKKQSLLGAET
mmetsp:Transcript_155394/g.498585  ORF Transcript_155394/g.498585 Transcript_155394/m.498585 type:complete len:476 (+) Transcript_155394:325-1752(+)